MNQPGLGIDLRVDRRGEVILEDLRRLYYQYPQYAERAIGSAMKSEGFRLKGVVQKAIRSGGPEGHKWPKLNPHTGVLNRGAKGTIKNYRTSRKGVKKGEAGKRVYRDKAGLRRSMTSSKRNPLLKLAGAVRYKFDDEVLSMGFLPGARYRSLVKKHAKGYSTPVTPRGRRRAFALGFPLAASTTELVTPPRPLMDPIFKDEEKNIRRNVGRKAKENVMRYVLGVGKR